jgi:hypothetical protein
MFKFHEAASASPELVELRDGRRLKHSASYIPQDSESKGFYILPTEAVGAKS